MTRVRFLNEISLDMWLDGEAARSRGFELVFFVNSRDFKK